MHDSAMKRGPLWPLALCGYLALLSCSTTGSVNPEPTIAAQGADTSEDVTVTPLAEGVWMHTSMKEIAPWGLIPSNGLLIERDDARGGILLIDSAWDDAQTEVILDWAERELGRRVRSAILTHAHDDKMGGVATLRRRGVATYASALSNELAPSRDLTPAEFDIEFAPTTRTSLEMDEVLVLDPGGGHTKDNIVVGHKASGVVFGGCLIRPGESGSLGNTADADVDHWDEAVRLVADTFPDATIVVPSHGPPAGRELFAHTIHLVESEDH